ncbi:MAG: peptide deformylase [Chitinophagales bacterium]
MILPIVAYGDAVLRKKGEPITADYPGLQQLIDDMLETMDRSRGVGLAAPQIGRAIQLFVIDSTKMFDEDEENTGIREVFINSVILEETGEEWAYEEGCLSIPGIREDVMRKPALTIEYFDRNFKKQKRSVDDMTARVIQHEFDHTIGKLFIDHIKPLRRSLLKSKLDKISKGDVDVSYKMKFPKK